MVHVTRGSYDKNLLNSFQTKLKKPFVNKKRCDVLFGKTTSKVG